MSSCRPESREKSIREFEDVLSRFPASKRSKMQKIIERGNVTVTENKCWEWRRAKAGDGYGVYYDKGASKYAHRAMAELIYGSIEQQVVRHNCHNPPCVNPTHLRLGTHKDNARDRSQANRSRHKLPEEHCRAILWLRSHTSLTLKEIAIGFDVSHAAIFKVVKGKTRPYLHGSMPCK